MAHRSGRGRWDQRFWRNQRMNLTLRWVRRWNRTPSLPVPDPANYATREKQIPVSSVKVGTQPVFIWVSAE